MSKTPIDPNAVTALNQMKYEIANELGLMNATEKNKQTLQAGKNVFFAGYVGGHMTRKLVEIGEKSLLEKN